MAISKTDGWDIFPEYKDTVGEKEFIQIEIGLPAKVKDLKTGKETNDFINREKQEANIPINAPWTKTVIGITFRSGYIVDENDIGKELQLVPDYDNPYDPDAIQIHFNNQQLGFCCQGATGQWTATKVKKLWELGYDIKARILAVCGGIPEFENTKSDKELLTVFINKYVLNFEKTFKTKVNYSNDVKLPTKKTSEVRTDCITRGLSQEETDKELNKIKKEWEDYKLANENQQKLINNINEEKVNEIIKTKPELVEKLVTLLRENKYRELKTFTGIDIKNKGVKYCLLITPTDKVVNTNKKDKKDFGKDKSINKKPEYKKTKATNSEMGFYME